MPDREMVRGINMTTYARKVNGEFVQPYPYGMSHLKADFPGKSFPHLGLLDEGFRQKYDIVEVEDASMPTKPRLCGNASVFQFEKDGKWGTALGISSKEERRSRWWRYSFPRTRPIFIDGLSW